MLSESDNVNKCETKGDFQTLHGLVMVMMKAGEAEHFRSPGFCPTPEMGPIAQLRQSHISQNSRK